MKKNLKFVLTNGIVVYKNYSRQEFLYLMNKINHIRILVCEDGTVYAWDGLKATHEQITSLMKLPNARAFNLGKYQFGPEEILDLILKMAKEQKSKSKKGNK